MLLRQVGERFLFSGGKHRGKELKDVAKEDPDYLQWLFETLEVNQSLSDTTWGALEDVMEEYKIPFVRKKKSKVASKDEPKNVRGLQRRAGTHIRN